MHTLSKSCENGLKQKIQHLYIVQGLSQYAVARKLGISQSMVCLYMKRFLIPARPRGWHLKGKKRPEHSKWMKRNRERMHTPEIMAKIASSLRGRPRSKEAIRKTIENRRGYRGKKNPFYGKHHTDETKKRISVKNKEKWEDKEYRAKMILKFKGRRSPSTAWKKGHIPWFAKREYHPSADRYTSIELEMEKILLECGLEKGVDFFHNKRIEGTLYSGDFVFPQKKMIIECDGPLHRFQKEYDKKRDTRLSTLGWLVRRFSSEEIQNGKLNRTELIRLVSDSSQKFWENMEAEV